MGTSSSQPRREREIAHADVTAGLRNASGSSVSQPAFQDSFASLHFIGELSQVEHDTSLPLELVEQVITTLWLQPKTWKERRRLRQKLLLISRTWRAIILRVELLHVWTETSRQALSRMNEALNRHPGINVVPFRDFCTSLTLRMPRGLDLIMFARDVAPAFLRSFKHLTHFGLDYTAVPPRADINLLESRSGLTTTAVILELLHLAGPSVCSVELRLGCPTIAHHDFAAPDLQAKPLTNVTRLSIHTDDGTLVRTLLRTCHKVQYLRLTCAFHGVLGELSELLPWLAELTLVMTPHKRMLPPCAHVEANGPAERSPLRSWYIPEALTRGLLQRDFRGRADARGVVVCEGVTLDVLKRADIEALAKVMRAARKHGVRVECRPLQEEREYYGEYLDTDENRSSHARASSHVEASLKATNSIQRPNEALRTEDFDRNPPPVPPKPHRSNTIPF
ncbi:hypothetical protein BKA62DRAFT_188676 [Auriculariales sp. MPI-PUGE-AT-0066]|nr:hypothetical protein BKA62DRAFT_188676 [Auriculariales sp. MPI-PUGE-AT-0066]